MEKKFYPLLTRAFIRLVAAWIGACSLPGCTTVTIAEQGGNTRIERHFGFISIEITPHTRAVLGEISSLGYAVSPLGMTLGAGHTRLAMLPKECRLVVWLDSPDQAAALRAALGDHTEICIFDPNEKDTQP